MKCLMRCALTLGLILAAAALALAGFAWFAVDWLNTSDAPRKADVMLILAGEPARFLAGADLYHQGYATQILVTKPVRLRPYRIFDDLKIDYPRSEEVYRQILIKKGVDGQRIRYLGDGVISTVDEARALRAHAAADKIRSVLVVTSPYHVRRTKMIFHRELPDVAITVVANPYEPNPERWWTHQDMAQAIVLELAKTLFYVLGGSFTSPTAGG